ILTQRPGYFYLLIGILVRARIRKKTLRKKTSQFSVPTMPQAALQSLWKLRATLKKTLLLSGLIFSLLTVKITAKNTILKIISLARGISQKVTLPDIHPSSEFFSIWLGISNLKTPGNRRQ